MSTPDITKLAREAGFEHFDNFPADYQGKIERLATLAIADFLARTGQYVTNEASREAAIAQAVADEREALKRRLIEYANNLENEGEDPRTVRAFICIVSMKELSDAAAIRVIGTP